MRALSFYALFALLCSCENKKAAIVDMQIRLKDSIEKLTVKIEGYEYIANEDIGSPTDSTWMVLDSQRTFAISRIRVYAEQRSVLLKQFDSLEMELKKY